MGGAPTQATTTQGKQQGNGRAQPVLERDRDCSDRTPKEVHGLERIIHHNSDPSLVDPRIKQEISKACIGLGNCKIDRDALDGADVPSSEKMAALMLANTKV